MWTQSALFAILGPHERQAFEAAPRGGVRRLTYYWSCGQKRDAFKAQKRAIGDGFELEAYCDHASHRELAEYGTIRVIDASISDPDGDESDTVPAQADGFTLDFTLAGPPELRKPLAVRLYCGHDDALNLTVVELEEYNGSQRRYSWPLQGSAAAERRIDVVLWPADRPIPNGKASGLRVAQWNVPVS